MGRFYSTNTPQNIDFVYKPPFEMMAKAMQNIDAANDAAYNQFDLLNDATLNVSHLDKDRETLKKKQEDYAKQIDDLTKVIASDPLAYRKIQPSLRNLSRTLKQDLTTGDLSTIEKNQKVMEEWEKNQAQGLANGSIGYDDFAKAKQGFLDRYKGAIDPETGLQNSLQVEGLVHRPDIMKKAIEASNGIRANLIKTRFDKPSGEWVYRTADGVSEVTESRIAELVQDALMGDKEVQSYFQQGQRLGYNPGGVDEEGNIKRAFTKQQVADEKGNITEQLLWNADSPIMNAVRSRARSQSYREEEHERTQEMNQVWATKAQIQAQREMAAMRASAGSGKDRVDNNGYIDAYRGALESLKEYAPATGDKKVDFDKFTPYQRDALLGSVKNEIMEKWQEKEKKVEAMSDEDIKAGKLPEDVTQTEYNRIKQGIRYPDLEVRQKPFNFAVGQMEMIKDKNGEPTGQIDFSKLKKNQYYQVPGSDAVIKYGGQPGYYEEQHPRLEVINKATQKLVTTASRDDYNMGYSSQMSKLSSAQEKAFANQTNPNQ